MVRSLRLRLQLFHAIILTLAVTCFGGAYYRQVHHATMGGIDAGLLSGARVFEGILRGLPPKPSIGQIMQLPLDLPPMNDRRRPPPPPGQMRDDFSAMGRGPRRDFPPMTPAYFAVFSSDGKLLRSNAGDERVDWTPTRLPVSYRNVGRRREVLVRGPHGLLIVVGRDIGQETQRLAGDLVRLITIGASVLGVGLIGGWWLAGKAIRPIQQISQITAGITASNLTERIDTSRMEYELQSLGSSLNSMLSRIEGAFDEQREFTADASHDLRTPLAVILSHCELALSRPRTPEEYQSSLGICLSAAHRMKSLVDGLLVLARSDAGELELHREPIDLKELATEAIELFSPYAGEHGVELKLAGEEAACIADRAAIYQVIANLMDNAILYNREGGSVTLSTFSKPGLAVFQIDDSGPGIPADALPRIFDRFYRVDAARKQQDGHSGQSGSGLGLSICKSVVDLHGGTLSVTSELTRGTTFVFELPVNTNSQLNEPKQ